MDLVGRKMRRFIIKTSIVVKIKIVVCTAFFFDIYYTLQSILPLSPPHHLLPPVSPEHNVVYISVLSCANHVAAKHNSHRFLTEMILTL